MFAVIELGGKQFPVQKGTKFKCEKLTVKDNETFEVERVLLVKTTKEVLLGHPYVKGVVVKAKVLETKRGKKIIGLKYKNKTNYRRHYGHRQTYSSILIEDIVAG